MNVSPIRKQSLTFLLVVLLACFQVLRADERFRSNFRLTPDLVTLGVGFVILIGIELLVRGQSWRPFAVWRDAPGLLGMTAQTVWTVFRAAPYLILFGVAAWNSGVGVWDEPWLVFGLLFLLGEKLPVRRGLWQAALGTMFLLGVFGHASAAEMRAMLILGIGALLLDGIGFLMGEERRVAVLRVAACDLPLLGLLWGVGWIGSLAGLYRPLLVVAVLSMVTISRVQEERRVGRT